MIGHGYLSVIKMVETDLEFEKDAVKIYTEFTEKVHDPKIKEMFINFAKAETGHVNGLQKLMQRIRDGEHEVKFYCPVCGWTVNFEKKPKVRDHARCRMCGVIFELIEIGGDYDIRRV